MVELYTKEWSIPGIDAVLFDKDGTFIDSHLYWGQIIKLRTKATMDHYNIDQSHFEELCLSLGLNTKTSKLVEQGPIAISAREVVISSLAEKLETLGIKDTTETIRNIFNQVHKEFQKEIFNYIKPIKEAEELFKKLKSKNIKLAVVTSDSKLNTDIILKQLNLTHYFDAIIGKESCNQTKNTGKPAEIALKLLDVKPEYAISIGDTPVDFEMAQNANLKSSILVATGQIAEDRLKKYTNNTVKSLSEVFVK